MTCGVADESITVHNNYTGVVIRPDNRIDLILMDRDRWIQTKDL